MIYIICRNLNELKYKIPSNANVIVNTSDELYLGEIAAWPKIYNDVMNNSYDEVGIYQARRAFHNTGMIIEKCDFLEHDIYATKLDFQNNENVISQFEKCHGKFYADLIKEKIPDDLKKHLYDRFLYPHNMFYTKTQTFKEIYSFIMAMKNEMTDELKNDSNKPFSFICERLISMYIAEHYDVGIVPALVLNKITGAVEGNKNGLCGWFLP